MKIKIRGTNRIKLSNFIEKVFLLNILLASGTMLAVDYRVYRYGVILIYFVLLSIGGVKINNHSNQIGVLAVVFAILFISSIGSISGELIKSFLMIFLMLTFANGKEESTDSFDFIMKCIFVFSIISNILFLFKIVGWNITPLVTNQTRAATAFYLMTPFFDDDFGVMGLRNAGIFWEPGVYMIYLNLFLIYYLYNPKNNRRSKICCLIYMTISIFLTGSIIGWGICGVVVCLYILNQKGIKAVMMTTVAMFSMPIILPYVYNKFMLKREGDTYFARVNDLTMGLEVLIKKPFFGYGTSGGGKEIFRSLYIGRYGLPRVSSNGLIQIMLVCGVVGIIVYFYFFSRFIRWFSKMYCMEAALSLIIWIIASLMDEPIGPSCFFFFMLSLGAHCKKNVKENNSFMINEPLNIVTRQPYSVDVGIPEKVVEKYDFK